MENVERELISIIKCRVQYHLHLCLIYVLFRCSSVQRYYVTIVWLIKVKLVSEPDRANVS